MDTSATTIRKMIATAGGDAMAPPACVRGLLDISVGKVVRELFDVAAEMNDIAISAFSAAEVLQSAPSPGLLFVFELETGLRSALFIDAVLVNGLVEISTGASESAVFRESRAPTSIDAALCRDFAEKVVGRLGRELADAAGLAALSSARLLRHETEIGRLAFEFGAARYSYLSANARLQDGIRGGGLALALPVDIWGAHQKPGPAADRSGWRPDLIENVLGAVLPLRADIETIKLPLGRALLLRKGDTLALSPLALSQISLKTDRNVTLLNGRLGQANGKKAVLVERTNGPVEPTVPQTGPAQDRGPPADQAPGEPVAMEGKDGGIPLEPTPEFPALPTA